MEGELIFEVAGWLAFWRGTYRAGNAAHLPVLFSCVLLTQPRGQGMFDTIPASESGRAVRTWRDLRGKSSCGG